MENKITLFSMINGTMPVSNVDTDISSFLRNEIGTSDVMSLPNALRILRIIQENLDKNGYEIVKSKNTISK